MRLKMLPVLASAFLARPRSAWVIGALACLVVWFLLVLVPAEPRRGLLPCGHPIAGFIAGGGPDTTWTCIYGHRFRRFGNWYVPTLY